MKTFGTALSVLVAVPVVLLCMGIGLVISAIPIVLALWFLGVVG